MAFGALKRMVGGGGQSLGKGAPSPVAIDFGLGSLKLLQIVPGEPPSLVAAACLPTPEAMLFDASKRIEWQMDQLPGLLRRGGFKGKRAVCAVPASMAFCKHMQLAKTDGTTMLSLIEAALPSQIGKPAHSVVFRHVEAPTPERGVGKAEVVVTAVGREVVSSLMSALKSAKMEPVGIHGEFQAIIRAFDYLFRRAEDAEQTTLYLDIGAGATNVVIAHGQRLAFTRTVPLGGVQLDETIAKQLKISFEEAVKVRRELIHLTARDAAAAREEAAARIASAVAGAESEGGAGLDQAAEGAEQSRESGVEVVREATRVSAEGGSDQSAVGVASATKLSAMENFGFKPRSAARAPDPDLGEQLEILSDEIWMCLRYHQSLYPSRKIGRAVFVGGEARNKPLCQHIAKCLRLPSQVADPMARVARAGSSLMPNVDLSQPQPGWTVPLGLCLCPTDL